MKLSQVNALTEYHAMQQPAQFNDQSKMTLSQYVAMTEPQSLGSERPSGSESRIHSSLVTGVAVAMLGYFLIW